MKRFGVISLMLFAFIIGFASTYSCGGGSNSNAADYAPLVHEHAAGDITSGELDISLIPSHSHSDYALSSHSHDDYADSTHGHDGADITSGTVPVGRLPVGSSSGDVAAGDHTHAVGDIPGSIDADTFGGYTGTFIDDLYEATCLLYGRMGAEAPSNINCDSFYKKVFITSSVFNGSLGGLSGADTFCQNAADNAAVAGTYLAWLSDSTTAVKDTFIKSQHPYVLLDGRIFAWNWNDLAVKSISTYLEIDENGATVTDESVWTGTLPSGESYSTNSGEQCDNWTSEAGVYSGLAGRSSSGTSGWSMMMGLQLCSNSYRLFCFEQ